jgi:hypothetical protein
MRLLIWYKLFLLIQHFNISLLRFLNLTASVTALAQENLNGFACM